MAKYAQKRRKIRLDRILLLFIIPIILIILVVIGFKTLTNNPYAKYEEYSESTKKAGDMEHFTDEKEETYYVSFYYPEYKDADAMNKVVREYKDKKLMTNLKQNAMYFISVDYDSEEIFDSYISLTFHQTVRDENDNIIKKEDISYNYDKKLKKMMRVEDVLRRDYITMLKEKATSNKIDTKNIKSTNLNNFILHKNSVSFYFQNDTKQKIDINYEDNRAYIHLTNKNIPSYFMNDPIIPKAQPAVQEDKRLIAFTFDDGPHNEYTNEIMSEFEKYDGRATFFMLGQNIKEYPDIVKDAYKRGFEVGNHSWSHAQGIAATGTLNASQVSEEVYKPSDEIFKATGFEPRYFRPPYGAINKTLDSVCGMDMVLWDIDSRDWENHNPAKMTNIIKKGADVHYEVVLMHDIHKESMEGVKVVLKELHDAGYQFVTIDTLMEKDPEYLTAYNNDRLHNIIIQSNVGK